MKVQYPFVTLMQRALLVTSLGAMVLGWIWSLHPWMGSKSQSQVFPTGVPWLNSEVDCVNTGRVWRQEVCWDREHDPTF